MIIDIQAMHSSKPLLLVICTLMLGCTASEPPEYGFVDWYISTTTGNRMTLMVYDKVCGRTHFRVRVGSSDETSIRTCSDSEGWADIRYKRASSPYSPDNLWLHTRVNANQSLIIR